MLEVKYCHLAGYIRHATWFWWPLFAFFLSEFSAGVAQVPFPVLREASASIASRSPAVSINANLDCLAYQVSWSLCHGSLPVSPTCVAHWAYCCFAPSRYSLCVICMAGPILLGFYSVSSVLRLCVTSSAYLSPVACVVPFLDFVLSCPAYWTLI